jgi:hypothetical protein
MTAPIFNMTNDQIVHFASAAGAIEPVDSASSRYSFVPTLDAVDLLRETGWFPIKASQSNTRIQDKDGFQKHCIRFVRDENVNLKDERVDLVLYNSHNLGSSFKLAASIWRKVCSNGLMVASEFVNFTHRHVGFSSEEFVQSAEKIAASASILVDQMEYLKGIHLMKEERQIFATAAHRLIYDTPELAPISADKLLNERRYGDVGNDLWRVFNRVQENIIKGGIRGNIYDTETGKQRKVTTRAVNSLDRDLKLNRALWVLTEKMAEIKSMSMAA